MKFRKATEELCHIQASDKGLLEIQTTKIPFDRRFELAAAHNGEVLLACGGRDQRGFLSAVSFVQTKGKEPKLVSPLPFPRARHAATTTADGRFIVVGGVTEDTDGSLVLAREVLTYDPRTDHWKEIAKLPLRTAQLVAEQVDGKLVVIGGDTGTTTEPGRPIAPARCRAEVQILDLSTGKWHRGMPKPTPETGVTSAVLDGEIFVCSSYPDDGEVRAQVEVYNVKANSWRRIPDMPTPRTGVACGFIKGKLYCINGQGVDLNPVSVVEVYDPSTDKWDTVSQGPASYIGQGYANFENRIFLVGGKE
ncbi:MAG: hypothetical protein O8C63_13430 [Candidatus Methanoperedens sp.]|nr:hypothetical protein [Candidatus Methanoperedens sp.]